MLNRSTAITVYSSHTHTQGKTSQERYYIAASTKRERIKREISSYMVLQFIAVGMRRTLEPAEATVHLEDIVAPFSTVHN